MIQDLDKIIRDFLNYHQIKTKDIVFTFSNTIPEIYLNEKNANAKGFRNIIATASQPIDPEHSVGIDEWAEYIQARLANFYSVEVLKELNEYLENKVYFLRNQKGVIDVLMYYLLYDNMTRLTFQEKEKYSSVSRWFDNIQQNNDIRQQRSMVPFCRCLLYN